MRTSLVIVAFVALSACKAPVNEPPVTSVRVEATARAANLCPAQASTSWEAGSGTIFAIEASTNGGSCADTSATITIRDANGNAVHTNTVNVRNSQALANAESPQDMERRLAEWITPAGASMDSTGDLAAWEAGAEWPQFAGVSFQPSAAVTRDVYEALRAADAPLYCYERDFAAGICLAMLDGALTVIGAQSYAG